jgi:hypothetical protein
VKNKCSTLLSGIAVLFVLAIYTLFIAIGPWRSRGYTSDYYSRLATSFRHGQLSLEQKPDPALLALSNPYDHKARKEIPVVGDASLYKGKYYLYFGPFPSLALALLASLLPAKPGDQIFVYLFVIGLFLLQCLLFRGIVGHFFSNTLGWFLPVGILILGLTGPYTRMLAHPFIHEAAIAGGQLLFVAGFYSTFLALRKNPIHQGMLLLAGILWAFSIATRTTQLLPVGFVAALTWLYIFHEHRGETLVQRLQRPTPALFYPLLLCGVLLAWYNWARFDSIFEFGLYYQLAAFNLQANYSILFSRVYLIQNIYNYFLNPFGVTWSFPFVHPLAGTEKPVLTSVALPNLYAVEGKFPGAFVSTPFLLFSLVPPVMLVTTSVRRFWSQAKREELFDIFDWTVLGLLGSSIAGALPTLLLFYVGFRYETEFIAGLTLLALMGFYQGYRIIKDAGARRLFAIFGTTLAVVSILLNLALSYVGAISF